MAIMLPVVVMLVYATMYLVDLVRARLQNHANARHVAFAMAHAPMHDYGEGLQIPGNVPFVGGTGKLAETRMAVIMDQTLAAFGEGIEEESLIMNVQQARVDIAFDKLDVAPGDTINEIADTFGAGDTFKTVVDIVSQVIDYGFEALVWSMGYNGTPVVRATSTTIVSPTIFPKRYLDRAFDKQFALPGRFVLQDHVALVADPWALDDGRDVRPGGYYGHDDPHGKTVSRFQKQVNNLYLGQGIFFKLLFRDKADEARDAFAKLLDIYNVITFKQDDPLANPLVGKVVSYNYRYGDLNTGRTDFEPNTVEDTWLGRDVTLIDGREVHVFDTTHMVDNLDKEDSGKNVDVFKLRGPYFMGCKDAQMVGCVYRP